MTRTARRTIRSIRRSIRAAVQAGQKLVTAVRGARFGVLVALFAAIDRGATVRIGYVDSKGVASVRDITPHRLDPTTAGNITCRAFDHRDGEDTTFRVDRMTSLGVG
jgi:predicted DNA-binding transcriptional regulator YafY